MAGLTLDAGALIAIDRGDRRTVLLVRRALLSGEGVAIPAAVLGQVWRDGSRQARLSRLIRSPDIEIVVLDDSIGRAAGQLCVATGTGDVIDATVVLCALARHHVVATSDPGDIRRLNEHVRIERV